MALPAPRPPCCLFILALLATGLGIALPLSGQSVPRTHATTPVATRPAPTRPPAARPTPAAARPATTRPAVRTATTPPPTPVAKANPFLPAPIAVEGFFADLSLSPKTPPTAPAGFTAMISQRDWLAYRTQWGSQADHLTALRTSGQLAFADTLIDAATGAGAAAGDSPDLRRFLLLRAAAIAYRSTGGFATADKAVQAYLPMMDKKSPAQVGALWSIANIIARMSVTPRADRIRYDAIAAKANMQLALLMLDADQVGAAEAITKQVGYHEGWLKSDPATRGLIAQVRNDVKQTAGMMDYLAGQYQPALHNEVGALTAIYLYGRYVKGNEALVANIPGRVPESPLAQLASVLSAAAGGDTAATYKAADALRVAAGTMTDARIRARTLYASMQLYDAFMASPQTEHERIERTLARIAREGVVADGARKAVTIDPFAPPPAPAAPVMPADQPAGGGGRRPEAMGG